MQVAMQKLQILALMSGLLVGLTGCSASNCDVEIYLDPELQTAYGQIPTLEVDIAGVNASQAQRLQNMNLDAYFTPNSPQRRALAPLTLHFSQEQPGPLFLDDDDEVWQRWEERGAQFVAVICNLPQFLNLAEQDASGGSDAGGGTNGAPSMLSGPMAEMANENSAVFNDGRVLLINMHDGFLKDSSKHLVQISVDGLLTLEDRPELYLKLTPEPKQPQIRSVQDLKHLEQQRLEQQLDAQAQSSHAINASQAHLPSDVADLSNAANATNALDMTNQISEGSAQFLDSANLSQTGQSYVEQMSQGQSSVPGQMGTLVVPDGQSKATLGSPAPTQDLQILSTPNMGKVSFPNLGK